MTTASIRTFLGANSATGFYSLYEPFVKDLRTVVIKGGPGSGKSGLMKKIASYAHDQGLFTEYCHCSSDGDSLDGIRIPQRNLCVVDGTSPHLIEPKFAGAKDEIFYTGAFWNGKKLRDSLTEIQELTERIQACFRRAYRYLAAAGSAAEDLRATAYKKTERDKMRDFARKMIRKHIKKQNRTSVIYPRFLSGITPQGIRVNRDTVYTLAEKVFVLRDPCRAGVPFLETVMEESVEAGQDLYVFYDPLCPTVPEHVALPTAGIAFVTENRIHAFEPQNAYRIHLERFSTPDKQTKEHFAIAERFLSACLKEALDSLKQEKAYHDDLEEFYIEAMDYKKMNSVTEKWIPKLFRE